MIRNGKEYDENLFDKSPNIKEETFNFMDTFERENTVSVRLRERDSEKVVDYLRNELQLSDEEIRDCTLDFPFNQFEINCNQQRIYVMKDGEEGDFIVSALSKNRQKVFFVAVAHGTKMFIGYGDSKNTEDIGGIIINVKRVIIYITSMSRKTIINGETRLPKKENKKDEVIRQNNGKNVRNISIDDAVVYARKTFLSTGRKIQAECYGVRGHYRHYKNGKVVFVKPYKKGWNRDGKAPSKQNYTI